MLPKDKNEVSVRNGNKIQVCLSSPTRLSSFVQTHLFVFNTATIPGHELSFFFFFFPPLHACVTELFAVKQESHLNT